MNNVYLLFYTFTTIYSLSCFSRYIIHFFSSTNLKALKLMLLFYAGTQPLSRLVTIPIWHFIFYENHIHKTGILQEIIQSDLKLITFVWTSFFVNSITVDNYGKVIFFYLVLTFMNSSVSSRSAIYSKIFLKDIPRLMIL